MTWLNTAKKLKKNFPAKVVEEGSLSSRLRDDESETEDDPSNPASKTLYYTDKDFNLRAPQPRY